MRIFPLVIASLLIQVAPCPAQTGAAISESDVQDLSRQALGNELRYFGAERKYTCTFDVVVREYGPDGWMTHAGLYTADLFNSNAGVLDSHVTASEAPADPRQLLTNPSVLVMGLPIPILASVLEHSRFASIQNFAVGGSSASTPKHQYLRFSFSGDSSYKPATDTDRIAQALTGTIVLDVTDQLLVHVHGQPASDVVRGRYLLLERQIPILDFDATLVNNTYLPMRFSTATFAPVPVGSTARQKWAQELTRTFGTRGNCQQFHVTTVIQMPESTNGSATLPKPR